eukprot:4430693-Prymnesium_polylepis.1
MAMRRFADLAYFALRASALRGNNACPLECTRAGAHRSRGAGGALTCTPRRPRWTQSNPGRRAAVSYTHLRAHETLMNL